MGLSQHYYPELHPVLLSCVQGNRLGTFVHSLNKHVLSACWVPGTGLGPFVALSVVVSFVVNVTQPGSTREESLSEALIRSGWPVTCLWGLS